MGDLKMIKDENSVLTDDELVIVRDFLRTSKHACLCIRNEHPRGFKVLNPVWGNHFKEINRLTKHCHHILKSPMLLLWLMFSNEQKLMFSSAQNYLF